MTDRSALRRLFARREALQAELKQIDAQIAVEGNRVSFAAGLRVPLRGPALRRLVEGDRG